MPEEMKSAGQDNDIVVLINKQLSVTRSAMHSDSMLNPYNPDDLYQRDAEYRIYESMLRDDQVSVAMAIKKDLVLAAGWDITCDDEGQEDVAAAITDMLLEDVKGGFDESLTEILSAYEFGFSLTEKIFGTRGDGLITLAMLKTRHPATWTIYTDEFGDVEKFEQYASRTAIAVPEQNLIHYVNNKKFQNPYGTSDLRAAYEAWFIKNQVKKYYAIFMEKASSPVPIGKYDKGTPQEEIDNLFNILKRFQQKTAMVIPESIKVDFLESTSNGEVFQKAINIFNLFIGRALYVPDLFGYSGEQTGGGSYSLGEHQIDMYFRHINRRRIQLERAVNKEIVKPLIINNFGFQEHYPYFKLRPVKEADVYKAIAAWSDAVKSHVYKPAPEEIDHFRALLNFPVVELEDDEPAGEPNEMEDPEAEVDETGKPDEVTDKSADTEKDDKIEKFAKDPFKHDDGEFYKRTDFKAIEAQMTSTEKQIVNELLPILDDTFADYGEQIRAKKIIENAAFDKIEKLKLKNTKLIGKILAKYLLRTYEESQAGAQAELIKSDFAKKKPTIDERFLAALEAENFAYIGDWEYAISKAARIEMIAAIKDGRPIESVIQNITTKAKAEAAVSLERYARTKTTEVMNNGRKAFFEGSDIVAGYQYSAILDNRTSAICEALHGKFFVKGSEPTPPMHFNCRSVLIPITKYEAFTPTAKIGSKPIGEFISENIGKGFSIK